MATHELASNDRPSFDGICFHAQQCVEKLMKALLIHLGIDPPRTHNLVWLDELLKPVCPNWGALVEDLRFLTQGAGAFRYPGAKADRDDAVQAMAICTRLRSQLLEFLGAEGADAPNG